VEGLRERGVRMRICFLGPLSWSDD
jgi:hypothetical protein